MAAGRGERMGTPDAATISYLVTTRKELSLCFPQAILFRISRFPIRTARRPSWRISPDSWLVIYFYPKDDTPGCTIQGKSFTATKADFDAAGIKVLGVSADDVASHKNFCNKFAFTIDLLSDTDASLMKALGIGQADWKGMKFWERTSFVVDPKGVIRKVYEKVSPDGHEKVLLDDIAAMKAEGGLNAARKTLLAHRRSKGSCRPIRDR